MTRRISSITNMAVIKTSRATNQSRCADSIGNSIVKTRANKFTLTIMT